MKRKKVKAAKACALCGGKFKPVGRQKYCSPGCATQALRAQSKAANAVRDRTRTPLAGRQCRICDGPFDAVPNGGRMKYCSPGCAAAGLTQAIERQRLRREAVKLERSQGRGQPAGASEQAE